jgi:hypothetical protein
VPEERDRLGPLKDAASDSVANAGLDVVERRLRRDLGWDPGRGSDVFRLALRPFG